MTSGDWELFLFNQLSKNEHTELYSWPLALPLMLLKLAGFNANSSKLLQANLAIYHITIYTCLYYFIPTANANCMLAVRISEKNYY